MSDCLWRARAIAGRLQRTAFRFGQLYRPQGILETLDRLYAITLWKPFGRPFQSFDVNGNLQLPKISAITRLTLTGVIGWARFEFPEEPALLIWFRRLRLG